MTYLGDALRDILDGRDVSEPRNVLSAAAHAIDHHDEAMDRLVRDLAKALGVGEDVVRLSQGLERASGRQKPVSADERA